MRTKDIIFNTLKNSKGLIASLIIYMLLSTLFLIGFPLIGWKLLENAETLQASSIWLVLFALSALLFFVFDNLRVKTNVILCSKVNSDLQNVVYKTALNGDFRELEKLDDAYLTKNIIINTKKITQEYIENNVLVFLNEILVTIAIFIAAFSIHPIFAAILLASLPIIYIILKAFVNFSDKFYDKKMQTEKERINEISNKIKNIKNIKIKNGIEKEENIFSVDLKKYSKSHKKNEILNFMSNKSTRTLLSAVLMVIFISLGIILMKNQANWSLGIRDTEVRDILLFILITPTAYASFNKITNAHLSPLQINNELEEIDQFLLIRSEIKEGQVDHFDDVRMLSFENVSYSSDKANFSNLSFEVKKNQKIAIYVAFNNINEVLVNLITKLEKPLYGSISINDCDFNRIDTNYLRELISEIIPDSQLTKNSIKENIIYPFEFDEYQYNDVLNKCLLKETTARFENKDSTIIDDEIDLTQDERLRIIWASALYRDGKIILIDDTNLNINETKDSLIKEVLKLKNRIFIFITNDFDVIKNCDKIVIFKGNKIVESGEIQELQKDKKSIFSSMFKIK